MQTVVSTLETEFDENILNYEKALKALLVSDNFLLVIFVPRLTSSWKTVKVIRWIRLESAIGYRVDG